MRSLPGPLLVVTDRHQAHRPLPDLIQEVLWAGGQWVWFREKDLDRPDRRRLACRLAEIARRSGACLSIGSDLELAAEIEAGGVHLQAASQVQAARRRLGSRALVGISAHSLDEVEAAAMAGADYLTISPIFPTPSKPGHGPALGMGAITRAAQIGIPVLALGGITPETVGPCRRAGAAGVAVMGDIMRSEEPGLAFGAILQAWCAARPDPCRAAIGVAGSIGPPGNQFKA